MINIKGVEKTLNKKLLKEIVARCYEISTQTKADAFFEYSPRTSQISVRIYSDGWSAESSFEYIEYKGQQNIYFEYYGPKSLKRVKEQLDGLYEKYLLIKKLNDEVKQ